MDKFLEFYSYLWNSSEGLFTFTLISHALLFVFGIIAYVLLLMTTNSFAVIYSPVIVILGIFVLIYRNWKEKNEKD